MVVLDADSLMTGDAIVALRAPWRPIRDAGIIQTLPLIVNRNTLFARMQQFAARVYGPCHRRRPRRLAAASDGNYWGHNAIIRIAAFAGIAACRSCPDGRRSAATSSATTSSRRRCMRRAGWAV